MVSPRLYYCQPVSDLQPISYILPLCAAILTECLHTRKHFIFSAFLFNSFICDTRHMFWWEADSTGRWQSHLVPGPGPRGWHLSLHHYYKPPPNIWSFIDITFNSIIVLSLILAQIEPPLYLRKMKMFFANIKCQMLDERKIFSENNVFLQNTQWTILTSLLSEHVNVFF